LDREGYETDGVDWVGLFVLCGLGFAQVRELFHAGKPGPRFSRTTRVIASAGLRPITPATAPLPRFSNPDGNGWLFQEVKTRLPGRVDSATTSFASANDLASALRRAAAAHAEHEKRTRQVDPNWPDWYAG
jgi:hypothetical protein